VAGSIAVALALLMSVVLTGAASADSSPCPPGQPSGRPPGQNPQQPGPPNGRPPQYPPGECNLQLSSGSVARGESVAVTGTGFAPGEVVALRLEPGAHALGTVTADSVGRFTQSVTVPSNASLGGSTVLATSASRELSAALEVTAAADTSRSAPASARASVLSRTGAEIAATALAGLLLIAVGIVGVMVGRRRRNPVTA
jgi:hypothetical protein